jgi:hypothetical protein
VQGFEVCVRASLLEERSKEKSEIECSIGQPWLAVAEVASSRQRSRCSVLSDSGCSGPAANRDGCLYVRNAAEQVIDSTASTVQEGLVRRKYRLCMLCVEDMFRQAQIIRQLRGSCVCDVSMARCWQAGLVLKLAVVYLVVA